MAPPLWSFLNLLLVSSSWFSSLKLSLGPAPQLSEACTWPRLLKHYNSEMFQWKSLSSNCVLWHYNKLLMKIVRFVALRCGLCVFVCVCVGMSRGISQVMIEVRGFLQPKALSLRTPSWIRNIVIASLWWRMKLCSTVTSMSQAVELRPLAETPHPLMVKTRTHTQPHPSSIWSFQISPPS